MERFLGVAPPGPAPDTHALPLLWKLFRLREIRGGGVQRGFPLCLNSYSLRAKCRRYACHAIILVGLFAWHREGKW